MYANHRISGRTLVLLWVITLILSSWNVGAAGVGVTVSTNTFAAVGRAEYSAVPPGLYCRAGLAWLPGGHLEIELYHIPQITPRFYSQVFFGLSASYWFLERKENSYLNAILEAGFLYGLDQTKLLNLKVTPIVFGCPSFGYAERFCTLGLLFDPQRMGLFWQLQVLALTLYL
jgi:hypothetical protein